MTLKLNASEFKAFLIWMKHVGQTDFQEPGPKLAQLNIKKKYYAMLPKLSATKSEYKLKLSEELILAVELLWTDFEWTLGDYEHNYMMQLGGECHRKSLQIQPNK